MAISKISKGNGFNGCLTYVLSKAEASLIAMQGVSSESSDQIAREMRAVAESRPIKKPVLHVSLSAAPGDRPTDEQWHTAARVWMREMGVDLDQAQYVLARHADRDHDHVHLILNRVQLDGKLLSEQQDFKRSHAALRVAEREAGLVIFEKPRELSKKGRLAELRQKIDWALGDGKSLLEFRASCARAGVEVQLNRQSTGRVAGLSFVDQDGQRFKGSSLGKSYSLSALAGRGLVIETQNHHLPKPGRTKLNRTALLAGRATTDLLKNKSQAKQEHEADRWQMERAKQRDRDDEKEHQL